VLVCNTAAATLDVFNISGASPVLIGSIPVGLDPVSVRAFDANQAWVVNHISDSVSVVDLAAMRAVALQAGAQEDAAAAMLLQLAFKEAADAYPTLGGHAAARVHAAWLERRRADYDPVVWERLDVGRRRTYEEVRAAEAVRTRIIDAFRIVFRRHHFIALPATFGSAVRKIDSDAAHRRRLLALNAPASLAGLPLVVAPARLPNGLTAGVQFVFPDMANFGWDSVLGRFG
jgi:Asp-tRNA(Asn)/Glu-tRNA(Gln) amidotransferase A subunit family amidase